MCLAPNVRVSITLTKYGLSTAYVTDWRFYVTVGSLDVSMESVKPGPSSRSASLQLSAKRARRTHQKEYRSMYLLSMLEVHVQKKTLSGNIEIMDCSPWRGREEERYCIEEGQAR